MSENNDITTRYTFWKLLSSYYVVIPKIQRDYAQGRTSENASAIRNELLESIYIALVNGENLDFDFVYGTVKGETLYPLDGQQRLTTFFLLHWYLAEKENRMDEAAAILKRFSYQTRTSSREFCELLVSIDYCPVKGETVSKCIKNENGYFKKWDTDPTISHMLTMLDAIHEKFYEVDDLFDSLVSEDEGLLTFSYLPMENYALTDDLYIKMNARGKALSDFENFKAKFIQHMKENKLPFEQFEERIDRDWTDLLWDYRDEKNRIDNQFMNLFCYLTEMLFLEKSEAREGDSPFRPNKIRGLIDFYQDESTIYELYSYLDLWKNKSEASSCLSSLLATEKDDRAVRLFDASVDIFSSIISGDSVPLSSKLILFAIMKRLVEFDRDYENDAFRDYVRLVRNFLQNTRSFITKRCAFSPDIRYGRHAIPIMQNFIAVLCDSNDPYRTLVEHDFKIINSEICGQEKKKAEIIINRPDIKSLIHNLEDLDLFKSSIFNIIPYVEENVDEDLVDNLEVLSDYHDFKLIRALLSVKDYGIKIGSTFYGERFFFGYKKDWYSVFTYNGGQSYSAFISTFMKQFEETEADSIDTSLDEIINSNLPNIAIDDWRYTIVKYSDSLNDVSYLTHPYCVLAKERCTDGSVNVHRLNSFIMNGYHVIPDYIEIQKQLGVNCSGNILSFAYDSEREGSIDLTCDGSIRVYYNDDGEFSVDHQDGYEDFVDSVIEEYNAKDVANLDKVEKCLLLCNLFIEKS